jgi:hypothetical protein
MVHINRINPPKLSPYNIFRKLFTTTAHMSM